MAARPERFSGQTHPLHLFAICNVSVECCETHHRHLSRIIITFADLISLQRKVIIYIYEAAASVCLYVTVCLFSGFLKNAQTDFHETFHGSAVICRHERKTCGKCWPAMCKNWETLQNGPIWERPHGPRALACAMACAGRWYESQQHGPIARGPGGVARSLRCGAVSNAFVFLRPLCLWCNIEKRHRASVRGTTVASSRRAV